MVSLALACHPQAPREILVHTGQHYDLRLSQIFFDQLRLRFPDHNLGVGSAKQGAQTGRMLEALEKVLIEERPTSVLVYGDTNSTLAGALAAAKLGLPVAHVEAGLRSFDRTMSEEINRVMTDHLSSRLFCPTVQAESNLRLEGFPAAIEGPLPSGGGPFVEISGDVMFDAALHYADIAKQHYGNVALPSRYALATIHRAENTDDPERLRKIMDGLAHVAKLIPVLLPLHPRTRVKQAEYGQNVPRIKNLLLMEPVGYLEMLGLEAGASLIITDSGGVQKEAFFQGVPCLTIRKETEWVELVEMGWNRLVEAEPEAILASACAWLSQPPGPRPALTPYGDGKAAQRVAASLANFG